MARNLKARRSAQAQKNVASDGKKRKIDGESTVQLALRPKKRKRTNTIDVVANKKTACQMAVDDDGIIKALRITFHPQRFCLQRPGNVPLEHITKFTHIQQLGKINYDSYAFQPRADTINRPWEPENQLRARRIRQKAELCNSSYQNEDGWRMELENRVFERFEMEVACQQCRRRLWKSHIQANPSGSNSRTSSLAERQKRRAVCECEPQQNKYSILSTGLTDVFSTRIGERSMIQDDAENDSSIEKKPDRIYGLRTTDAMDKILQQPRLSHLQEGSEFPETLTSRLKMSCNPDSGGRASIYPFLVMEAKSLKGGSNFKSIEAQTALPIRNHLYLQLKLQEDEFNRMKVPGGPLTWFFAYMGETWRVYGCYVTKSGPNNLPDYNIILLWQGNIINHDDALQLVLIVDYIVDWARDIYRPSIMRQLMSVADMGTGSTYTIIEEPDILSLPGYVNSWLGDRPGDTIAGVEAVEPPPDRAFDALEYNLEPSFKPLYKSTGDHMDIRVWDSAKYESRVRGLYITDDHTAAAETFLTRWHFLNRYATDHPPNSNFWFVLSRPQDINTIEQTWTGNQNIRGVNDDSTYKILISLCVNFRINKNGALIRGLTYLALSEPAILDADLKAKIQQEDSFISAEELSLKLREVWASTNEQYFLRYSRSMFSEFRVDSSEFDRLSNRVVFNFREDAWANLHAGWLAKFFSNTSDNQSLYKRFEACSRYNVSFHSLMIRPYCIEDPAQACVYIYTIDSLNHYKLSVYATSCVPEEINTRWAVRQLVQTLAMSEVQRKSSEALTKRVCPNRSKIILWIVSDPQWDLYLTIKTTLTMPGMDTINETLACYRRVLLKHRCCHERATGDGAGDTNVARDIHMTCKKCKWLSGTENNKYKR